MPFDPELGPDGRPFRLGDWTVEPLLNRLRKGKRTVFLEPKVMRLLVCLAAQRGEVVTRQVLLADVWDDLNVVDGAMARAVYQLRRRLAECEGCGADVETIRQVGFRLVCADIPAMRSASRLASWAGHPLTAWSATALAASVALALALQPSASEPTVRLVTAEAPVAATRTSPTQAQPPRPAASPARRAAKATATMAASAAPVAAAKIDAPAAVASSGRYDFHPVAFAPPAPPAPPTPMIIS